MHCCPASFTHWLEKNYPHRQGYCGRDQSRKAGYIVESHFVDLNPRTIPCIQADLAVDCTDNNETRLLINDYCKKNRMPWIHTAAIAQIGSAYLIHPDGPCFQCFNKETYGETCNDIGVVNATTSFVGGFASSLAINFLAKGAIEPSIHRFNLHDNTFLRLAVKKNEKCQACKGDYAYLNNVQTKKICQFCSNGRYQVTLSHAIDIDEIDRKLSKLGKTISTEHYLSFDGFLIFPEGRVIVKAKNEADARKKYDEIIGI